MAIPKVANIYTYPEHMKKFEECVMKDFKLTHSNRLCGNWMRHMNVYIPTAVLDKYGIHYCIFAQHAGQVVITFTKAYHQGFNTGTNVAEALNYGDKYWSTEGVRFYSWKTCG